jgi:hypothetical protein
MQKILKSVPNSQYLQFHRVYSSSMADSLYANQNLFLLRKVRTIVPKWLVDHPSKKSTPDCFEKLSCQDKARSSINEFRI